MCSVNHLHFMLICIYYSHALAWASNLKTISDVEGTGLEWVWSDWSDHSPCVVDQALLWECFLRRRTCVHQSLLSLICPMFLWWGKSAYQRERERERERESQPSRHRWQASHPHGLVREQREREGGGGGGEVCLLCVFSL